MSAVVSRLYPKHRRSIPSFVEAIDSPENDLRIWTTHFDSISSTEMFELTASLDPAERTRAARFHFDRDRKAFVATRGILRGLLGVALDVPASEIFFEYGAHGKPAMVGDLPTLRFNTSHSAGSAIFALAWNRELGIDLEAAAHITDKGENLSGLATRILSPRELVIWRELPNDAIRGPALLRAWTRKEAYIKATGEGLFHRPQDIEVALDAGMPKASLMMRSSRNEGEAGCDWTIHDLTAPAGFVAAVAMEQAVR